MAKPNAAHRIAATLAVALLACRTPPATRYFATVGVNENIIDASWQAITDAFAYHLIESGETGK